VFRTTLDELKGEDLLARSLRPVERSFDREPITPGTIYEVASFKPNKSGPATKCVCSAIFFWGAIDKC
jgi:hypothetical protein